MPVEQIHQNLGTGPTVKITLRFFKDSDDSDDARINLRSLHQHVSAIHLKDVELNRLCN